MGGAAPDLRIGVVVPAAGSGQRMGGVEKALLQIGGRPLYAWSVESFLRAPGVVRVVVVLAPGTPIPDSLTDLHPRVCVAWGGASRTASVASGLEALGDDVDLVAVHDVARPFVEERPFLECVRLAGSGVGAVVGHPSIDTLKEVEDGRVIATPDRSRFWEVQTPQVFPREVLQRAYGAARTAAPSTDCASLVERLGIEVRVVEGSRWNLKVTVPEDFLVAEALLQRRAQRPRRIDVPVDETGWAALIDHLRRGGLIAYPTGTVYGFGGLATTPGLDALAALKLRNVSERPFLVLLDGPDQAEGLEWTPEALRLAAAFWPGPLTLILRDPAGRFPVGVRGPEGGVAIRVDAHSFVRELLPRLGEPITSSSANRPGTPPAASAEQAGSALEALEGGASVLVIDGGPTPGRLSSTLVDLTGSAPRLVREGAISAARLREYIALPG